MAKVEAEKQAEVIIQSVLESISLLLRDVDARSLRDMEVNAVLTQLCRPMLRVAGIRLVSLDVWKQAQIRNLSKREREKEVVQVKKLREITRNTRLIVEAVTQSRTLNHHLQMVFFVNSDRSVSLEGEPWIDTTRYPKWNNKMAKHLEDTEKALAPHVPYAFRKLLEVILRRMAS
jgi:hypothetical protein